LLELFSEVSCGSFSCSTAGQMCLGANVDPTAQKRSGSDYYASRAETSPLERYDTEYTPFIRVKDESGNGPLYCLQIGLLFEKRSDRAPIESTVALCPRGPHSWAFAAVEHPELNHGEVGSSSHDSSEGIDLSDHGPLCNAADRGIARHLPDCLERARNQPHTSSEAGGSNGCFGTGMTGADDYDIEFGLKVLQ
jgi:hypothetical protein